MPALNSISVDKLARLVGTPASPTLVDLRAPDDGSGFAPGSVPYRASDVASWSRQLRDRPVVVIDADGGALAQGVAAWLHSDGRVAEYLDGGYRAWIADGQPQLLLDKLPPRNGEGQTVWVTRARPKVDRIACPWLIRRFIDPDARFLFVAPNEVMGVAGAFSATPFDLEHPDVFWSHRGDECTFDLMAASFGLIGIPAIAHLAHIVRGADTGRPDIVPEAAGLVAISLGLSRMYADDEQQLEAGMAVYDALYRWCRDARSETHDWTSHQAREARR